VGLRRDEWSGFGLRGRRPPVLSGELEAAVGGKVFVLRAGDCLIAPRDIPHQLRNPGNVENHYLLIFSPSGFEEFLRVAAVPTPHNVAVPAQHIPVAVRNAATMR
jgi:glyoxylate utilization-related uncharacterized protein